MDIQARRAQLIQEVGAFRDRLRVIQAEAVELERKTLQWQGAIAMLDEQLGQPEPWPTLWAALASIAELSRAQRRRAKKYTPGSMPTEKA